MTYIYHRFTTDEIRSNTKSVPVQDSFQHEIRTSTKFVPRTEMDHPLKEIWPVLCTQVFCLGMSLQHWLHNDSVVIVKFEILYCKCSHNACAIWLRIIFYSILGIHCKFLLPKSCKTSNGSELRHCRFKLNGFSFACSRINTIILVLSGDRLAGSFSIFFCSLNSLSASDSSFGAYGFR